MRIAICDDVVADLAQTENTVQKVFSEMRLNFSIDTFSDILRLIEKPAEYNVVFLDIEMQDIEQNGIWAAQIIKKNKPDCAIIFTTNHEEYIDDVIEKYAFRYWAKPIDEYRLRKSVTAMLERMKTVTLEICGSKERITLSLRDIIYITPQNKHCKVVTAADNYTVSESYKEVRRKIISKNFCDCHGSYCVNLNYVEQYTKMAVVLASGQKRYEVHMSRRHYKAFKEQMFIIGGEQI